MGLHLAGGLWPEAAVGLNRRQKEALVDMRHGRAWSNGEYREHFGVTAEEAMLGSGGTQS